MSFKRTATGLIIISVVTAIAIGVYLWFNFNSRSNLIMVVPKNCHWIYHFQTSKVRKITTGAAPAYLDSLLNTIKTFPAFAKVKEPADPGIKIYSDLILFGNKYGSYAALTLNSEARFEKFIKDLPQGKFTGNIIESKNCKFVKIQNKPLYLAFKHKALIIFNPKDTSDNLGAVEAGLNEVFAKDADYSIASMKLLKGLYESDCQIVFYCKNKEIPTHGVVLDNLQAKFISGISGRELLARNALKLFDAAAFPGETPIKKNKTMASTVYLNHTFKSIYLQIKQFSK